MTIRSVAKKVLILRAVLGVISLLAAPFLCVAVGLTLVVGEMGVAVALFEAGVVAGNSVVVLPPITTSVAYGLRLITVPETVMVPPGVRVMPSITNVVPLLAVKTVPSKVMSGGFVVIPLLMYVVLPFTTIAVPPGRREIVDPM